MQPGPLAASLLADVTAEPSSAFSGYEFLRYPSIRAQPFSANTGVLLRHFRSSTPPLQEFYSAFTGVLLRHYRSSTPPLQEFYSAITGVLLRHYSHRGICGSSCHSCVSRFRVFRLCRRTLRKLARLNHIPNTTLVIITLVYTKILYKSKNEYSIPWGVSLIYLLWQKYIQRLFYLDTNYKESRQKIFYYR